MSVACSSWDCVGWTKDGVVSSSGVDVACMRNITWHRARKRTTPRQPAVLLLLWLLLQS